MKKIFALLTVALLAISLAACGSEGAAQDGAASQSAISESVYPIEIESDCGTEVIEEEINAVAIFDLGMLDIMDTLGSGNKVVAVTHGLVFTDYLSDYEGEIYFNLGGFKEWDEEVLIQSNPDLIMAGFCQNMAIDTMTAIAPTIYFATSTEGKSYIDALERRVAAITQIFGVEDEAEGYLEEIRDKLNTIKEYTASKKEKVRFSSLFT